MNRTQIEQFNAFSLVLLYYLYPFLLSQFSIWRWNVHLNEDVKIKFFFLNVYLLKFIIYCNAF